MKMKETGEVTLETEFEKVKQIDIEHWEMVRGKFSLLINVSYSIISFQVLDHGRSNQLIEFL